MKPICVPCQRFFKAEKNGFNFIEGLPNPHDAQPGNLEPEHWEPYKIWVGDLWKCRGCGTEIVVGFCSTPIMVHHEPGFTDEMARLNADQFQVNDC